MTHKDTKSISDPFILSTLPVAAAATDKEGKFLAWNEWFASLIDIEHQTGDVNSVAGLFDISRKDLESLLLPLLQGEKQAVEIDSVLLPGKIPVRLSIGILSKQPEQLIWIAQKTVTENHNNQYFQHLFQSVPFGIVVSDGQDIILDCNSAFEELFGYKKEHLKGKKINDMIVPDPMKDHGFRLTSDVADGQKVFHETRRVRADGELVDVSIVGKPIVFSNHQKKVFAVYQDITERKLAEKSIIDRESQFAAMLHYLPGMVYRCKADRNYTMLFISDGSSRITGYDPDLFLNRDLSYNEIILEEYREFVWDKWSEAIENNTIFQETYQICTVDGRVRWVWERGHAVKDRHDRVVYLEGYIEDITEQRNIQNSLLHEKELLQALMDNIPDTIYFKDRESRFLKINKAQADIIGVTNQADAVGKMDKDFFDISYAKKTFEEEQEMMLTGESVISNEERVFTNKGWRWLSTTKVPIYDENNEISGLAGVSRDITTNKELENRLRKSEKDLTQLNQEKDKLFSVIAHDMRSPFNSFLLLTELLADKSFSVEKEELVQLAKSMHHTAAAVAELLENLLEWSRIQRGLIVYKPETVILKNILKKNLDYFQTNIQNKKIDVEVTVNEEITMFADPSMLSSVIRNLISNAIKFTPKSGRVKISAERPDNEFILLKIEDSGVGMNSVQQEKLFTLHTRGTMGTEDEPSAGLGLILVREFIKIMKGRIYLTSRENVGTTFFVELPGH